MSCHSTFVGLLWGSCVGVGDVYCFLLYAKSFDHLAVSKIGLTFSLQIRKSKFYSGGKLKNQKSLYYDIISTCTESVYKNASNLDPTFHTKMD